jgi:REP element-mobilizing transposase RayT
VPYKGATGEKNFMKNVNSVGSKKISGDTRSNWVTMLFVTKKRYRCFRKQSHIETCAERFRELEHLGFEFGEFGFAVNHVHFQVNIPKKYSIEETEIILKSETSKRMFERHPGFRKRYPKGAFWSGYEHYQSTGVRNLEESTNYLRRQQKHHGVTVIDDRQQTLQVFPPSGDAA